jgi:hypothetical protein
MVKQFVRGIKSAFKGSSKVTKPVLFNIGEGIMRACSNVNSFYGMPMRRATHKKKHTTSKRIKVGGRWYKRE